MSNQIFKVKILSGSIKINKKVYFPGEIVELDRYDFGKLKHQVELIEYINDIDVAETNSGAEAGTVAETNSGAEAGTVAETALAEEKEEVKNVTSSRRRNSNVG
ncbi:MAG: hypothetical protein KIT33_15415 [Candidatus Kapabacteria bacterium]|nr:hypothetical protein [Ignavibacteriota bacterium]MCW5886358.1 hypothetical protein [Candidatus Kapabacteria bacterium]